MPLIKNVFEYIKLERYDSEAGRKYITPLGDVPSVTTILEQTKSQDSRDSLQNWRDRIGHDEAAIITKQAASIGSIIHSNLEKYIKNEEIPKKSNIIYKDAALFSQKIIEHGLSKIDFFYGVEVSLHYQSLYAGTTDAIGSYNNEIVIIDFKNSRKTKTDKYISDYKKQIAAYAIAHDEMYNTNITSGIIMMISREGKDRGKYQEWVLTGKEFQQAKDDWIETVSRYYSDKYE